MLRFAAVLILALGLVGSATATLIAEAQEGNVRVELHDVPGPCQGRALWAQYQEGKIRISGCWVIAGEIVQIAWLDGDVSQIAARIFKKPKDL
jgi:hypothetical protein